MKKAHRANTEDPRDFVLLEEIMSQNETQQRTSKSSAPDKGDSSRLLADDENVYQAQNDWKTAGRFVLMSKAEVSLEEEVRRQQILFLYQKYIL